MAFVMFSLPETASVLDVPTFPGRGRSLDGSHGTGTSRSVSPEAGPWRGAGKGDVENPRARLKGYWENHGNIMGMLNIWFYIWENHKKIWDYHLVICYIAMVF